MLAKIAAIVPEDLRPVIDDPAVGTPPLNRQRADDRSDVARLRRWCREGRKLSIGYIDETGAVSERVVRPFLMGYVATVRVVAAWCELRRDFRVFRTDGLTAVRQAGRTYVRSLGPRLWLTR